MKSRRFISLSPPPDWTRYQIARYTIAFWGGATHAWLRVYLPGAGWVDFDPTNSIIGNRNLIRVAVAWDPAQALPLWGSFIGYRDRHAGAFARLRSSATSRRAATVSGLSHPMLRPICKALRRLSTGLVL
jgi:hypothetical protein